ncbi:NAD synthetase, NH3/glutamine-dependent [Wigglesworthia glossinidia endosymbiont of Glossina morsitans morsitans (Yale colony)]|uniref:NH(3)-dependent NAD(+) synthetase n=1 Tax=Wigglesworthia glossinidia endosymbiont of Glossina morsitans morsitans (Yale colony) TaxID=1142511 RepID=H6Q4X3_WIGGL|nr:ammonia-dependent NAD(+) synthetase [Wigglesworthia glossinidia]AFA41256.1 NAD synthetase, NH3/glutamine-dependent [Wigglesworthia glossinidia endosymbiont of Glossina morsitans morsitans (Yale colony)]
MNNQLKIIKKFKVKPVFDAKTEFKKIKNFLTAYLKKFTELKTLVLGISGGQDSTLTGKICQEAINDLKYDCALNYQFIAVRLPYGIQYDEEDCKLAINFINPDQVVTINIKSAVESRIISLQKAGFNITEHLKGNEKSRERMKIQYSIAGATSGLVVGTCHASEAITGFFTKYGDSSSDISPILHLNKRQGKSMLQYLSCPQRLYLKPPSADLNENYPGYPDEFALGISYDMIDDYLEGKTINKKTAKIIEDLYYNTQHKRNFPICI